MIWLVFSGASMEAGTSSKLKKAYLALNEYNYFQAKKIFREVNKHKSDAYSAFGLAIIFSRNDNPFSNIDSAGKYICLSYHRYLQNPTPIAYVGYTVNATSILNLADTISTRFFKNIRRQHSVSGYNYFLSRYYFAPHALIKEAVNLRDELEFNQVLDADSSVYTREFLQWHPQSEFYKEAARLLDRQIYEEQTRQNEPKSYMAFIDRYPKNTLVPQAKEKLFNLYRQAKDTNGLSFYVAHYPESPLSLEAWKLLFSLTVSEFSFDGLKSFVNRYPAFPLKTSILKELELNKLVLYPCQQGDLVGYVDPNGKMLIKAQYDAGGFFSEGLAVVSRNDSVFFINKENVNPFKKIFSEAGGFKYGIAPVKQGGKWYFINRQGQVISKAYDEVNELSDEVYVVKVGDKYGALNHFGQSILEVRFDKLGDFTNGFAYYTENGNYGFVSRSGSSYKAEFEWISDVGKDKVAIFRQQNKFGLVNSVGKKLLPAEYDLVLRTNTSIFVLVTKDLYGFYSLNGCFYTPIMYEYSKEKSPEYYTNGTLMKLIKKNEQALIDENGKMIIPFGQYQEVYFASNGLVRVKQKNKYGYLDSKFNPIIPLKYQQAEDFQDSVALVKFRDNNILINTKGIEIFSTGAEIQRVSAHYFMVNDDARTLINNHGEIVYTEVDQIQRINPNLFIITLNNEEIKLLSD